MCSVCCNIWQSEVCVCVCDFTASTHSVRRHTHSISDRLLGIIQLCWWTWSHTHNPTWCNLVTVESVWSEELIQTRCVFFIPPIDQNVIGVVTVSHLSLSKSTLPCLVSSCKILSPKAETWMSMNTPSSSLSEEEQQYDTTSTCWKSNPVWFTVRTCQTACVWDGCGGQRASALFSLERHACLYTHKYTQSMLVQRVCVCEIRVPNETEVFCWSSAKLFQHTTVCVCTKCQQ